MGNNESYLSSVYSSNKGTKIKRPKKTPFIRTTKSPPEISFFFFLNVSHVDGRGLGQEETVIPQN